mgnify:CR=1 FL=1
MTGSQILFLSSSLRTAPRRRGLTASSSPPYPGLFPSRFLVKDDLVDKFGSDEKSISAEDFDTVDYLHTYDIGYQYLFLRRGKEIEYICYLGPENLEDHIEEIIGDLSN